jgi:hypothetical protein
MVEKDGRKVCPLKVTTGLGKFGGMQIEEQGSIEETVSA